MENYIRKQYEVAYLFWLPLWQFIHLKQMIIKLPGCASKGQAQAPGLQAPPTICQDSTQIHTDTVQIGLGCRHNVSSSSIKTNVQVLSLLHPLILDSNRPAFNPPCSWLLSANSKPREQGPLITSWDEGSKNLHGGAWATIPELLTQHLPTPQSPPHTTWR